MMDTGTTTRNTNIARRKTGEGSTEGTNQLVMENRAPCRFSPKEMDEGGL